MTGGTSSSRSTSPSRKKFSPSAMAPKKASKVVVSQSKKALPHLPIGILTLAIHFETGSIVSPHRIHAKRRPSVEGRRLSFSPGVKALSFRARP